MNKAPESNPSALVARSPKTLAIANRQLHIAGQALARIEKERYIEFFATHPQAREIFINAVSNYYPLSEGLIEKYRDRWDWARLSVNKRIAWTSTLIERYVDQWNWGAHGLSLNDGVPWTETLIERHFYRWHWGFFGLSMGDHLPWTATLIERYTDRWDWKVLSNNDSLPWTDGLIARYAGRWDFEMLSANKGLPWTRSLIDRYADRWGWKSFLSSNESLPWSEALIEHYKARWGWPALSRNKALPWSLELIKRYSDRWDWRGLSWNEGLPWTLELIEQCALRWDWKALAANAGLPWSAHLIARHADRWDHNRLSSNAGLPWSERLIEQYADRWNWSVLSGNPGLPWSEALIEYYADRWDWSALRFPEYLGMVLRQWTEDEICAVMDKQARDTVAVPARLTEEDASRSVSMAESESQKVVRSNSQGSSSHWQEFYRAGVVAAVRHLEAGARAYPDFTRAMVQELGDGSRPYLRSWYEGLRCYPGFDPMGMTPAAEIDVASEASVDLPRANRQHAQTALDPNTMLAGMTLSVSYIETGTQRFVDFAKRVSEDLAKPLTELRPYLRAWYNSARDMLDEAGQDVSDMDDPTTVLREFERLCSELAQGEATAAGAVPVHPERMTQRDVLNPFMDKLEDLLRQEDDPPATMRWLETYLYDEGLVGGMRTDNPMAFAIDLMENLLEKDPDSYIVPPKDPRAFENAEELILAMLKGTWDH
ncbi:hypothetical protein [uncultured Thiodictyon sp.]|uniref:hypothetical protein n=1 Tax=uncultured Thiodictyon sp. TaxID=1846217 RepID=UPI0025D30059|nr:hypothetical protein [uncultured Thiodictyon sp.]